MINAILNFWKFDSGIPYAAFWKLKQDGLRYIYQMKHESLLCKWKLRSLSFLESQLKIWQGTPGLRFRPIASRILIDLRKTMEKCVNNLLHALLESMMRPYWSTMGFLRG